MTFDGWTFAFEVVNFVALAYILQRLLYRPLHEAVDRRRSAIQQAQEEAEAARRTAEAEARELQAQLGAIAEERQKELHAARQEAEAERDQLLATAAREAERRASQTRDSLQRERAAALRSLQDEVVQDAARLAGRLLRDLAGEDLDARLVRRLADEIRALPQRERVELAQSWRATDTVTLEAAHDLTAEVVEPVRAAVVQLLGREVGLSLQTAPELISGVRVRLDGHVWDASLQSDLEGVADGNAAIGPR